MRTAIKVILSLYALLLIGRVLLLIVHPTFLGLLNTVLVAAWVVVLFHYGGFDVERHN